MGLHLVTVGDYASVYHIRRSRYQRKLMGDIASGTALGSGYGHSALTALLEQYLGGSEVGIGKDGGAEYLLERLDPAGHFIAHERGILVMSVEAEAYQSRLGQIGEMEIGGQGVLPRGYLHGQGALGVIGDHEHGMLDMHRRGETLAQGRKHSLGHHGRGLEWHTGHRHKHVVGITLKPHDRRGAHAVLYHTARAWHYGLGLGERIHLYATAVEYLVDILGDGGVGDHLASEIAPQHLLGDVVLGGAETTGGEHYLAALESAVDGTGDVGGIIAHGLHVVHFPSVGSNVTGYPARIGIGDLPYEQLVTDHYYRYVHIVVLA